MTVYFKPDEVPANSFGSGLRLININAFSYVEKDGSGYWVEWDDSIEPFPSADKINAAFVISNWNRVRKERNELLAATDFYALSDVTMSADMATYREALRDLPASTADSEDVVWPTKP
tara:strand:- start:215 stop:568 length:354 start_codon:yes stop_codon:yes gene_type:complete